MSQQSSRSGYEIEVAKIIAEELKQPLEVKWIAQRDPSYFRSTIGAGVCDAIMSVPSGFGRLATTAPWYRTGFYFVTRKDVPLPHGFDDAGVNKMTIGVPAIGQGETPPAIALTRRALEANLRPYSVYEPSKMIDAVAKGQIDMAIVWGPFAGWFAADEKPPLAIGPTPEKDGPTPLFFDMAIGVKKGNTALKDRLDAALAHRQADIRAVLVKWRVPVKEN